MLSLLHRNMRRGAPDVAGIYGGFISSGLPRIRHTGEGRYPEDRLDFPVSSTGQAR